MQQILATILIVLLSGCSAPHFATIDEGASKYQRYERGGHDVIYVLRPIEKEGWYHDVKCRKCKYEGKVW